jgi:hypothetical protein
MHRPISSCEKNRLGAIEVRRPYENIQIPIDTHGNIAVQHESQDRAFEREDSDILLIEGSEQIEQFSKEHKATDGMTPVPTTYDLLDSIRNNIRPYLSKLRVQER